MITSGKHDGSSKYIDHYKDANGGSSYKNYNWFYWLPRIKFKAASTDIYWLCYGWNIWNKF